ncbi:unnamed protein product [Merluccius merluccius]
MNRQPCLLWSVARGNMFSLPSRYSLEPSGLFPADVPPTPSLWGPVIGQGGPQSPPVWEPQAPWRSICVVMSLKSDTRDPLC